MLQIRSSILGFVLLLSTTLFAQTFTAKYNTAVGIHCNGYYEYLPAGYDPNGTTTYPLLIASHGLGERGDGSTLQLPWLISPNKGLAALLNSGSFPSSFTVNGQTFKFIIICPQYTNNDPAWPGAQDLDDVLTYAINHYKVDINRIYLTGLSMGGGMTFNYVAGSTTNANRIAAILTICPALPPGPPYQAKPDSLICRNITATNLPVYATHNQGDNVVPVSFTDSMVHYINAVPSPSPLAKKTIFTTWVDAHDAWTQTYDPAFLTQDGMNVYEWMLQYQRSITPLPVTLSSYKAWLSAPGQVTISWSTVNELNNHHFTLEWSSNGIDFSGITTIAAKNTDSYYTYTDLHPAEGQNFYRLSQTDVNGKKTVYGILPVRVNLNGRNGLTISPNPVTSQAQLTWDHAGKGNVSVSLFDLNGKRLKHWSFSKSEYQLSRVLDLGSISSGLYLIECSGGGLTETKRILKK